MKCNRMTYNAKIGVITYNFQFFLTIENHKHLEEILHYC